LAFEGTTSSFTQQSQFDLVGHPGCGWASALESGNSNTPSDHTSQFVLRVRGFTITDEDGCQVARWTAQMAILMYDGSGRLVRRVGSSATLAGEACPGDILSWHHQTGSRIYTAIIHIGARNA
jgi:hypothetical protein